MKLLITILLYPFAVLYDLGTRIRNHLYDIGNKRSFRFDTKVIAVGNLSVGGTGKTPVVAHIIQLLQNKQVATLSRGYGRKTRGFRVATSEDNATTLGDEPFLLRRRFPNIIVSVCVDRALAIPEILFHREETEVIIMDDAYQHRSVIPDCNLLLTTFDHPFFSDYILPAGRLRESRYNAKRADAVIVTKCPDNISTDLQQQYIENIYTYTQQKIPIFFTKIKYHTPLPVFAIEPIDFSEVFVFTGIAKHQPMIHYLKGNFRVIGQKHYADHHIYSQADIDEIVKEYNQVKSKNSCLMTTEKDMVRMLKNDFEKQFIDIPLYYLPISVVFCHDNDRFEEIIYDCVER